MTPTRRTALLGIAASTLAAPAIAANAPIRWRMVTSWPKALPGPGVSADRLAARINAMSAGRLEIEVFPANTILPALNVLDGVSGNMVEMGHTATLFWRGRLPASPIFTTAPFGLGPLDHEAWLAHGGGQALWDEIYAPLGVKSFLAGNTGPSMGGWFRKPIKDVSDMKGLRIRAAGLSGEIFNRLGATSMVIAPGDTYASIERGTIDAVEFLSPANDISTGVQKVAPHYAIPGFNKPNGASEAMVSHKAWDALPKDLQAIIGHACAAEHAAGLAQAQHTNADALTTLVTREGVRLFQFPPSLLEAAHKATLEVMADIAGTSALAGRIVASYQAYQAHARNWSQVNASMTASLLQQRP